MKIEHEAMVQVIGDLVKKDEFISLLFEFDARKTTGERTMGHKLLRQEL